jgi:hypothetical protein
MHKRIIVYIKYICINIYVYIYIYIHIYLHVMVPTRNTTNRTNVRDDDQSILMCKFMYK